MAFVSAAVAAIKGGLVTKFNTSDAFNPTKKDVWNSGDLPVTIGAGGVGPVGGKLQNPVFTTES
tara:strand:+ start:2272 stop:2463 length:192 start_codon:yes stop_codon:yes gene_type:complete